MILRKNKILFATAAIGVTSASVLVVSCSSDPRFDQVNDNTIKIALGWDQNSSQARALQKLVDMYNETQKGTEDYMKVETAFEEYSYEGLLRLMEQKLILHDTSKLYNLVMAYITGLGIISGYNMQLRLDKTPEDNDKWGISGNEFEKAFLNFNNNIGGLNPGGIYALPLTKSTPVTALNTPLLSYIFETMVSYGAKIKPEDQKWFDDIITLGRHDRAPVLVELGKSVDSEKSNYENGKYILSRDIFNNGTTLIDFAVKVQQLFEKSRNNPKGAFHALAIEDISNFISTQIFSMTAKEAYDFTNYYTKIGQNGYVDYSGYSDPNSESYKKLSETAKVLITAAKTGAIYVGDSSCCVGNFPAYQFRRHQIAMSIGSSSNYSLNFFPSSGDVDTYSIEIDRNGNKLSRNIGDGNVFTLAKLDSESVNGNIAKITSNGRSGFLKKSTDQDFSSGNIVLRNPQTDAAVEEFSRIALASEKGGVILNGYKEFDDIFRSQRAKFEASGVKLLGKSGVIKDGTFSDDQNIYGLLNSEIEKPNSVIGLKKLEATATLQENELIGINAPRKWAPSDKINSTYVQGASMLALHSNPEEDKATRKFVHWLTGQSEDAFKYRDPATRQERYRLATDSTKFTDDVNLALKTRPLKFLSLASPYVVPYKGVFDENTHGATKFATVALNEFREASNPDNKNMWSLTEEPTDLTTSQFRTTFIAAWRNPIIRILNGHGADVKETYAESIKPSIDKNRQSFTYD